MTCESDSGDTYYVFDNDTRSWVTSIADVRAGNYVLVKCALGTPVNVPTAMDVPIVYSIDDTKLIDSLGFVGLGRHADFTTDKYTELFMAFPMPDEDVVVKIGSGGGSND